MSQSQPRDTLTTLYGSTPHGMTKCPCDSAPTPRWTADDMQWPHRWSAARFEPRHRDVDWRRRGTSTDA
eukprot:5396110-Prymnesium_polylepis.1